MLLCNCALTFGPASGCRCFAPSMAFKPGLQLAKVALDSNPWTGGHVPGGDGSQLEMEAPSLQTGAKWRRLSIRGVRGGFRAEKLPARVHFELPFPQIRLRERGDPPLGLEDIYRKSFLIACVEKSSLKQAHPQLMK